MSRSPQETDLAASEHDSPHWRAGPAWDRLSFVGFFGGHERFAAVTVGGTRLCDLQEAGFKVVVSAAALFDGFLVEWTPTDVWSAARTM